MKIDIVPTANIEESIANLFQELSKPDMKITIYELLNELERMKNEESIEEQGFNNTMGNPKRSISNFIVSYVNRFRTMMQIIQKWILLEKHIWLFFLSLTYFSLNATVCCFAETKKQDYFSHIFLFFQQTPTIHRVKFLNLFLNGALS